MDAWRAREAGARVRGEEEPSGRAERGAERYWSFAGRGRRGRGARRGRRADRGGGEEGGEGSGEARGPRRLRSAARGRIALLVPSRPLFGAPPPLLRVSRSHSDGIHIRADAQGDRDRRDRRAGGGKEGDVGKRGGGRKEGNKKTARWEALLKVRATQREQCGKVVRATQLVLGGEEKARGAGERGPKRRRGERPSQGCWASPRADEGTRGEKKKKERWRRRRRIYQGEKTRWGKRKQKKDGNEGQRPRALLERPCGRVEGRCKKGWEREKKKGRGKAAQARRKSAAKRR